MNAMDINRMSRSRLLWLLAALCVLSLFLFLGATDFNTRGEPREAVVAYAMLERGNWILPITNGVDMAYKPPLFHWCVALGSLLTGGVTEYTSRLPSALALTAMVLTGFVFFARRRGKEVAWIAALITLTNFEVHRAGVACRVDMLLAALMVLALYRLYRWAETGLRGVPWTGIVLLSGALLTKGPVGVVLPCLVVAVFAWIRGMGFGRIVVRFAGVGLAACVLPLCWYVAAWRQGGDAFLQLVLEENVWRFLGKMSYASHENPAWYNVVMLLAGFAPYTLLVLLSLFTLPRPKAAGTLGGAWRRLKDYVRTMDDTRLFALLSFVLIFVFYCIPKSKRGVYLLPVYPFGAYFLAEYVLYLIRRGSRAIRWYGGVLAVAAVLLVAAFGAVKAGWVSPGWFHGRHAAENVAYLAALERVSPGPLGLLLCVALPVAALGFFGCPPVRSSVRRSAYACLATTFLVFLSLDGLFQPAVLNVKSNREVAGQIRRMVPEGPVYSYITDTAPGNRMHPFSINFYLGDRVIPFEDFAPASGFLILGEREREGFFARYGDRYEVVEVYDAHHKSCDDHDLIRVYQFRSKPDPNPVSNELNR